MNDNGSPGVHASLAQLATSLNLEVAQLKIALAEASDLLQQNGNASLSLHVALARMGYQINGLTFYPILDKFRRTFAGVLANEPVVTPAIPVPQMNPNPYSDIPHQSFKLSPSTKDAPPASHTESTKAVTSDNRANSEVDSQATREDDVAHPSESKTIPIQGSDHYVGSPNKNLHEITPAKDTPPSDSAQGEAWHHGLLPSPYSLGKTHETS
ncbi:hypothetical protein CC86DRAFT_420050 [Ophiobolus disseminans]|uniref:Uncharacterized protein n=1 Tax=Ophiobolus disseminans TaxID=1469910 RepID=A0A6A6ZUS9_9PLEO|nr:hypothetical protein CC86DRAFT_420050 [Ophiobolus disseminans]